MWWGRRSAWIGLLACWCSGPDCPHSLLRHPKVWGLCVCPLSHPLKASPLLIAKETCMIGVTQECLPPPQNNPGQRAGTLTAGRPSSSPDSCSPSKPSQSSCTVCAPVGQAPWAPTGPCTLGGLCEGGPGRPPDCVVNVSPGPQSWGAASCLCRCPRRRPWWRWSEQPWGLPVGRGQTQHRQAALRWQGGDPRSSGLPSSTSRKASFPGAGHGRRTSFGRWELGSW